MRKIGWFSLILILLFSLSACDDFAREVDGVTYKTECYKKKINSRFTLVKLAEESETDELINEEVSIGIYDEKEYYFQSLTVYNLYRVEIQGERGEYYTIIDAIEKHDYTIEFLIDWCENSILHEDLKFRTIE